MGAAQDAGDTVVSAAGGSLPGQAVGVLVPDADAWLSSLGRGGPPGAVVFGRDDFAYRWIYVPADPPGSGRTVRVRVGDAEEAAAFADVVLATRETLRLSGRAPEEHVLVHVTVNAGRGSPEGADRFVATSLSVVEGSARYPLRADAAVREAAQRCRAAVPSATSADTTTLVTWMSDRERLRVVCRVEATNRAGLPRGTGIVPEGGRTSPDPSAGTPYGTLRGTVTELVFEASPSGDVEPIGPPTSRSIDRELPPPGAPPRRR